MLSSSQNSPQYQQQISSQSYMIITQYGDMLVVKQGAANQHHHHHHPHGQSAPLSGSPAGPSSGQAGDQHQHQQQQQQQQQQQHQTRPIIMTFHDLGLNSELQFATFCECEEVKLMLQTFTMIHVNFIGQESPSSHQGNSNNSTEGGTRNSGSLPENFKYPSVEQMAESIVDICAQLRVRSFIAIAVGAGAHIVGSLALMRPDLVDGLFLINPVITSCSITEWLYFKMSAIASNHRINQWSSSESTSSGHSNLQLVHNETSSENSESPQRGQSRQSSGRGLRKLLNAAHINLPVHHHHSGHSNNNSQEKMVSEETVSNSNNTDQQQQPDDLVSISSKMSSRSGNSVNSTPDHKGLARTLSGSSKQASGSRLRQLIFSRNFRVRANQQQQQQQHPQLARAISSSSAGNASDVSDAMCRAETLKSCNEISEDEKQADNAIAGDGASEQVRPASSQKALSSSGSVDSLDHGQHRAGKRPPIEYLMYHHFGSGSAHRFRRSSDTPPVLKYDHTQVDNTDTASTSSIEQRAAPRSTKSRATSRGNRSRQRLQHTCSQSQETLEDSPTSLSGASNSVTGRMRSGSVVCMDEACLAACLNDRQRHAYMQSVYKRYFNQLDAHNLWLFAQSFAKRRNLNLRKDCGAAAHAAAAAATLGTSICTAFIGHPGPTLQTAGKGAASTSANSAQSAAERQVSSPLAGERPKTASSTAKSSSSNEANTIPKSHHLSGASQRLQQQNRQQAAAPQVAGTKVKRTFTCQTLIMCSSVQMHCERAFKLMSLLNPLQATWIKTDHLLVLEERPDKVCQALRLFLQGIGYSMSTYERRLRLSSPLDPQAAPIVEIRVAVLTRRTKSQR